MELSIILVNYKTPQLTFNCIASIYEKCKVTPFEIIIIDNQSADNSKERLTKQFPKVIWIDMGYNSGFSRANNRAIKVANGHYLLFLNTDTIITDNAISICIERLKANKSISGVSLNMTDMEGHLHVIDPNFNIHGLLKYSYLPSENWIIEKWCSYFSSNLKRRLDYQEIDFLVGAYIMCRKTDFQNVNGFNNDLFLYGEDIDLSCKLAKIGKLKKYDDLSIIHLEGGSTTKVKEVITFFSNSPQMQLSNLVWIRNWYGPFIYSTILINYWLFIPFYFVIRLFRGLLNGKLRNEIKAPTLFMKQLLRWTKFYPSIIFNSPSFYKYDK